MTKTTTSEMTKQAEMGEGWSDKTVGHQQPEYLHILLQPNKKVIVGRQTKL